MLADAAIPLQNTGSVVGIIGTCVTVLAVLVGAVWAYYKFIRGRTFQARLNVEAQAEWLNDGATKLIRARVTVTNVGGSKVPIVNDGTTLQLATMKQAPELPGFLATWDPLRAVSIMKENPWLEPGEAVFEDVFVRAPENGLEIVELKVWIICEHRSKNLLRILTKGKRSQNTTVSCRAICGPGASPSK